MGEMNDGIIYGRLGEIDIISPILKLPIDNTAELDQLRFFKTDVLICLARGKMMQIAHNEFGKLVVVECVFISLEYLREHFDERT